MVKLAGAAAAAVSSELAIGQQILIEHLFVIFLKRKWLFCYGKSFSYEHPKELLGSSGLVAPAHPPIFHHSQSP